MRNPQHAAWILLYAKTSTPQAASGPAEGRHRFLSRILPAGVSSHKALGLVLTSPLIHCSRYILYLGTPGFWFYTVYRHGTPRCLHLPHLGALCSLLLFYLPYLPLLL